MNRWLKLSGFSLVGIIISMLVLAFISPSGFGGTDNMQDMQSMGMSNNMNMPMNNTQSNGMGMMSMGNMKQGGMGMMSMPMNNMSQIGSMPMGSMQPSSMTMTSMGNGQSGNMLMMIMQKLNQLEMEINQLKQQMNNSSMPSSGGGGGMGMM